MIKYIMINMMNLISEGIYEFKDSTIYYYTNNLILFRCIYKNRFFMSVSGNEKYNAQCEQYF